MTRVLSMTRLRVLSLTGTLDDREALRQPWPMVISSEILICVWLTIRYKINMIIDIHFNQFDGTFKFTKLYKRDHISRSP